MHKSYFEDRAAIQEALSKYLEACNKGEAAIMKPYFHDEAVFFGFGNPPGAIATGKIQWFYDFIDNTGPDPEKDPPFYTDILDLTESTAVVRVSERWQGMLFTDYLTFLKTPEGWKITAKMFHTHWE